MHSLLVEGTGKKILPSLGSGSESEEEDDEKPMFGEGDDGDYYEQLVIIIVQHIIVICFNFLFSHRKSTQTMKKRWKCSCQKNPKLA